jgi:hypothetical protein
MKNMLTRILVAGLLAAGMLTTACENKETNNEAETSAETSAETTAETGENETTAEAETTEEAEEEGGQWVTSETYGVKFRVPDDWQLAKDEESVSATDSDGTTTIILLGSESEGAFQQAVEDMKDKVELKEVKVGTSEPTVLNGLAGFKGNGTGVLVKEDMDQEIQFIAYSLRVGEKAISLMIFSEAEMYEAKKELILGIANTLQKAG